MVPAAVSETVDAKLARLRALAADPERAPMKRSQGWPSSAAGIIRLRTEIETLRMGLREALAIADAFRQPEGPDAS